MGAKDVARLTIFFCLAAGTLSGAVQEKWELGRYASRTGDIVTVDVPSGKPDTGLVTLVDDLSRFDGQPFEATIKARGFGVSKTSEGWLGFKFMASYKDAEMGEMKYPGAPRRIGDFPWQTVRLVDLTPAIRNPPSCFSLGIQAGWGRVEFDLSTFSVKRVAPVEPETNATHRCVYTARVTDAPRRRGVMLGKKLAEDDFKTLHDWGVTLARFQMSRDWDKVDGHRDLAAYDRYIEDELADLEKVLVWAGKYGIQIVIDLHAAPGARNKSRDLTMCHESAYAEAFIATWRKIATRFGGRPEVYGFDLVNEPVQREPALPGCDYWSLQSRAAEAIRAIDPETPILVESNESDGPGSFATLRPLALTNIIYQVHVYQPITFTHQAVFNRKAARATYPDAQKGWNADFLKRVLNPVRAFEERHGARIYVGEFSAVAWADGAGDYLRDCIDIFEEYGWDWTYHAFREWPGWSVEHEASEPHELTRSTDNPRKRALLDGFRR